MSGFDQIMHKNKTKNSQLMLALQELTCLNRPQNRRFFVGLTRYTIEGFPYWASGLTLDRVGTPEINITDEGFSCTAFFPPHLLKAEIVKQNGLGTLEFRGKSLTVVRVRVNVKATDIFLVSEFIDGEQHDLYSKPVCIPNFADYWARSKPITGLE